MVSENVEKLTKPLGTHFETSLVNNVPNLADQMGEMLTGAGAEERIKRKEFESLRKTFDDLQQSLSDLAKGGSARMKSLADSLDSKAGMATPAEIKAKLSVLKEVPVAPPLPPPAAAAAAQLSVPEDTNDLDRLQDPADPLWRVLSDPQNDWKWNSAFATNFFYAEGNSSVVLVRESPIHYRVQRGNNNPTALVQSQLEISGAIADAAIEVAGAASGIKLPVPQKVGGTDGGADAGKQSTPTAGSENARLTEVASLRRQALRSLQTKLSQLRKEFAKKPDDATRASLLGELEGVLRGHLPSFKPADQKAK